MAHSGRRSRHATPALAALAMVACLLPGLAWTGAQAADDGTCVGEGEYQRIKSGMTIEKLSKVLHDQTPFAEVTGKGKKRYRWYAACEEWQPERDVVVRYHQPVVGRRTVTKKWLDVYVAR